MLDAAWLVTLLLLAGAALTYTATMLYPSNLVRWLQRKRYQYEVTFSLYMLTPTEKFIFNSFLFLFLSMIIIAASLYLPEYITMVVHRALFYYSGDEQPRSHGHRGGRRAGVQQPKLENVVQRAVHTSITALGTAAAALWEGENLAVGVGA